MPKYGNRAEVPRGSHVSADWVADTTVSGHVAACYWRVNGTVSVASVPTGAVARDGVDLVRAARVASGGEFR